MFRVGNVCVGAMGTGSSRIQTYLVHDYLLNRGIYSNIILPVNQPTTYFDYYPIINAQDLMGYDIVVFQKVRGNSTFEAIKFCKEHNIISIYELDDWREESGRVAKQCDYIIVPSEYLKNKMFHSCKNVFVMRHGYEHNQETYKRQYNYSQKVAYVYGCKYIPDTLLPIIQQSNWQLVTIGRHKTDTYLWHLDTVAQHVVSCDVGIIPADISTNEGRAKSWNRAILFMSLGLPVIVSAVPEYYNIVKNGVNGFIAYTEEDWKDYLNILKDKELCEKMGKQAREDTKHLTTEACCEQFYTLFCNIMRKKWLR